MPELGFLSTIALVTNVPGLARDVTLVISCCAVPGASAGVEGQSDRLVRRGVVPSTIERILYILYEVAYLIMHKIFVS